MYGISTFIAWLCTYYLLRKFDENRPDPADPLLNQLENDSHHDKHQNFSPNHITGYQSGSNSSSTASKKGKKVGQAVELLNSSSLIEAHNDESKKQKVFAGDTSYNSV